MYAKTDAQYDKIVKEMISNADKYGYAKCLKWAEEQAAIRHKLEQQATGAKSAK